MTTTNTALASNAQHLLDALDSWAGGGDSTAVLEAVAAIRTANDPASAVSRAEAELAAAAQRAVVLDDIGAVQDLRDELEHSDAVMAAENVAAFQRWLGTMDPARLTGQEIDVAAEIARALRAGRG